MTVREFAKKFIKASAKVTVFPHAGCPFNGKAKDIPEELLSMQFVEVLYGSCDDICIECTKAGE